MKCRVALLAGGETSSFKEKGESRFYKVAQPRRPLCLSLLVFCM